MKIAITDAPVFSPRAISSWLTGDFDGLSLKMDKEIEGGPYLSVQPDSSYQGRPSGGGAYESFKKQGSDLVCSYQHDGSTFVHVIPFKEL